MKKTPFDQNTLTDLTEEQISEFKKEYGNVYEIIVEDKKAFIHKPTRQILDLAMTSSSKKSSLFNETILKNCWLAGDKDIVFDDEYFMGAGAILDEVITFKTAELKKL
jgi:hypothetical protein